MITWYIARGAGLAALVLLSATACLGALMSRRGAAGPRIVLHYVHRVTATLGLSVLALHLGMILADSYAGVGWLGALVPFRSGYRTNWVALGTIAAYLFAFAGAIGFARARFAVSATATRVWRGLHCLAYVGWGAAMLHGLNAGTDSALPWVRLVYAGCGIAVGLSLSMRIPEFVRASTKPDLRAVSR
jgi:hypothetical protein